MAKFTYLVLQHVHRWRTFDIVRLGNSQSVELLGIVAGSHAPELQELSISYTGGVRSTTDLFEGQSRQLRRVRLHSTLFLSWNSVLFSNLHTLHLSNLGRRGPSMHQVNSILQASPALVELKLESFFSESSVEPSIERTGPIELLSLRKFTISGVSPSLATHILDSTRIPNCENIIIHIDASTKASYATNETFLHSARVIAEASDFAHVELGAVQFTLRCWKQNKAALEVRINGKGWEFKAAESLLQLLDTSSDLDVFIDTKMYRNSDSLAKILSLLPNLRSARTLRLSQRRPSRDDGSNALIGELGVRRRVNGDMRWPLPLLETLRVGSTSVDAEALLTTIRGRFEATSDPPSKLKSIELTKNLEGCFRELESTFGEGVASCYDPASDSGIEGHNWFDEDENDEENTDDE
ncbi:hypothetical protein FRB96_003386 [Tulasnella sp. 330]|nr:hypothetical protein FRB96_003386 [Tulasnella sp. 330]KAG8888099.1 hypothetical protein FRB98_008365 [Tulasnella sp. 332]